MAIADPTITRMLLSSGYELFTVSVEHFLVLLYTRYQVASGIVFLRRRGGAGARKMQLTRAFVQFEQDLSCHISLSLVCTEDKNFP